MPVKKKDFFLENQFESNEAWDEEEGQADNLMGMRGDANDGSTWDMHFRCDSAQEQADLIQFLKHANQNKKTPLPLFKVEEYDERKWKCVMVEYYSYFASPSWRGGDASPCDFVSWIERNFSGLVEEFVTRYNHKNDEKLDRVLVHLADIVNWANSATTSTNPVTAMSGAVKSSAFSKSFTILKDMGVISENIQAGQVTEESIHHAYTFKKALLPTCIAKRAKNIFSVGFKVSLFLDVSCQAYDSAYLFYQNKKQLV